MNREIHLGKTGDGALVTVAIALRPLQTRARQTIDHKWVTPDDGLELSIMGTVYANGHAIDKGGNVVSAGQCSGELLEIATPCAPWTLDEIRELHTLWDRWHLNDMRAACVHQVKLVRRRNARYGYEEIDLDATTAANDCPEGYKYGSAWLYEPLPTEVIDRIHVFQRRLKP